MSGKSDSSDVSRTDGITNIAGKVRSAIKAEEAAEAAAKDGDFKAFYAEIAKMGKDQVVDFVKSDGGKKAMKNLTKHIREKRSLNGEQENAIAGIADKILASVPKPPNYIKKFVVACCDVLPESLSKKFASFVDPWKEEIAKEEQNKQVREQAMKLRSAFVSKKAQSSPQPQPLTSSIRVGVTTPVGARIGR